MRAMTVKELIDKLKEMPQDYIVIYPAGEYGEQNVEGVIPYEATEQVEIW
jgi:hypothetical protein